MQAVQDAASEDRSERQENENRYRPASTAWLVVTILFANKCWISDASSMSLYWIARLPIERSQVVSPLARPQRPQDRAVPRQRSRQWKIAVSLAVVGGLAAPFV